MKYAIYILLIILMNFDMNAQEWKTPIIEGYGKIVHYENAQDPPDPTKVYKIIFHITDGKEREGVNEGLWKIARLINLMGDYGVPKDNLHIVAIVSGSATPFVLSNAEYLKREEKGNPNLDLLEKLKPHNVKILVCGQALAKHKIDPETQMNKFVRLTTSALTAIPNYQLQGYMPMF